MSLVVESLSYRAGGKKIVDNISFISGPGEFTVIVGPNGAGKSTLLALLTGDLSGETGSIHLDGQPLEQIMPESLARKRSVLLQSSSLQFPFKAKEVVMLGRYPYQESSEESNNHADAALRATDALPFASQEYLTLSGGEKQRIQLSRTYTQILGQKHPYLFLDEPTSALDIKHRLQTIHFLKERAEEGYGIIAILHDLDLCFNTADRVLLLAGGRMVASGPPASTLTAETIQAAFDVRAERALHDGRALFAFRLNDDK
ncbi:MAG: heme ABC transporter ATP-binding protein [Spirochaetales bacterium]|nr:heme ABC transporter ATP-binding protein [Spirochaetales bacterium]